MAYQNTHVYIRVGGHFGGSSSDKQEEWSTGFRFAAETAMAYNGAGLQAFLNAAWTPISTFHSGAAAKVGTCCYVSYLTGAYVGIDGKYNPITQLTKRYDAATPVAGSGVPYAPWNTSHVLSLRTDIPRGYGSNGRVYWPMLAGAVQASTGRLSSSESNGRTDSAATMFSTVNALFKSNVQADAALSVLSAVGGGARGVVTGIRTDLRLDSIERRENKIPPSYYTKALT